MKKVKLFSIIIMLTTVFYTVDSQEISEIKLEPGYTWNECGHFSNFSPLTTVLNKAVSATILNAKTSKKCGFFSILSKRDNSAAGYCLFSDEADISIIKHFQLSNNEIQFFANYRIPGSTNQMAVITYNTLLNSISNANLILPELASSLPVEIVDVAQFKNEFYILVKTEINYLSGIKFKTAIIKFSDSKIVWSKIINSIAPINSELPLNITALYNGNVFIAGKYAAPRDSSYRSMFMIINNQAEMVAMKRLHFYTSDRFSERTILWNGTAVNGRRLHLFSQAIDEEGLPGSILATMLDTSGNLLTWRNYDFPMILEEAIVEDNAFILTGRANELSNKKSFFSVRINASNAIVEGLYSIFDGHISTSITGSSVSYNSQEASIESIAMTTGIKGNTLLFIKGDQSGRAGCSEELGYAVLKDPLEAEDLPYTIKDFECIVAPIAVSVANLSLQFEEVCNVTNTNVSGSAPYVMFPNPVQSHIQMKGLQEADLIRIVNYMGYEMSIHTGHADFSISMENYSAGFYFLTIERKGNPLHCIPFVKI